MSIANAFVEAPAYDDLVARGHALVPDFADRAARCESDCRVSDELSSGFGRPACTRLCCRRPMADTRWVSRRCSRPASRSARSAHRRPGYAVSTWRTTGSADCFRRRRRTRCGAKIRTRSSQAPTHRSARRRWSRAAIGSRGDFRFPAGRPEPHGISAARCCRSGPRASQCRLSPWSQRPTTRSIGKAGVRGSCAEREAST